GRSLPFLKTRYKDFAPWQNQRLRTGKLGDQEKYWLNLYAGAGRREIPRLNLPTDYPRPPVFTFKGDSTRFKLGPRETTAFKQLAAHNETTLYMNLLAALNLLLHMYTGQDDIIVGCGTAGRRHPDVENLIGLFVNMLAVRCFPRGELTYLEFLNEVRTQALAAFENQELPLEQLIDKLELERDTSRNPLFDVSIFVQNFEQPPVHLQGLEFSQYTFDNKIAKFDLNLFVWERDKTIDFALEYYSGIFKPGTVKRMTRHLLNIIRQVAADPHVLLADIRPVSQEEKQELLNHFNRTAAPYPREKTVHRSFEEQVEKKPGKTAVVGAAHGAARRTFTYRELNEEANRLAVFLRQNGFSRENLAGIFCRRSIEMLISILAVLKAGGAYVPFDTEFPPERIRAMLAESISIIISQSTCLDRADRLLWQSPFLETLILVDHYHPGGDSKEEHFRDVWDYVAADSSEAIDDFG
ncbi:MAG: AMP-binding protein, partial [bacterium]|nr:AMP-binding protein [bacterium]